MGHTLSFCKELTPLRRVSYSVPVNGIIYNSLSYLRLHLFSFRTGPKRAESQSFTGGISIKASPTVPCRFHKTDSSLPIDNERLGWVVSILLSIRRSRLRFSPLRPTTVIKVFVVIFPRFLWASHSITAPSPSLSERKTRVTQIGAWRKACNYYKKSLYKICSVVRRVDTSINEVGNGRRRKSISAAV